MDRNPPVDTSSVRVSLVALRKESVDRNFVPFDVIRPAIESLSARRAWIEMIDSTHRREPFPVALRKESVDRNCRLGAYPGVGPGSLSARRAWIEITMRTRMPIGCVVALRKESVDRNY